MFRVNIKTAAGSMPVSVEAEDQLMACFLASSEAQHNLAIDRCKGRVTDEQYSRRVADLLMRVTGVTVVEERV